MIQALTQSQQTATDTPPYTDTDFAIELLTTACEVEFINRADELSGLAAPEGSFRHTVAKLTYDALESGVSSGQVVFALSVVVMRLLPDPIPAASAETYNANETFDTHDYEFGTKETTT